MPSHHSETVTESVIPIERNDIVNWAAGILENQRAYRNIKVLGSGTFGDVRLMQDTKANSSVAVKIVKGDKISEGEMYLWPYLHHLNVVPLLELMVLGEKREVVVFVMPVQSKTLIDALFEWYIVQLDNVPIWFHDILLGIDYLHSKNLCHMDIKADNVLISSRKVAKICDFTFLNETTKTLTRSAVGSPLIYDPPEACKSLGPGVTVSGKACDMWCFGIMCLEVLTKFKMTSRKTEGEFSWFRNVYPSIFKLLQVGPFFRLMDSAFVASRIDSAYSLSALDFLHGFLQIDGEQRVSAEQALRHSFLKGELTGNSPDSLWTHRVADDNKGFEIYKKKCLNNQNVKEEQISTKEEEEEEREIVSMCPETKLVSSCSDSRESESENDHKQVHSNENSVVNDAIKADLVEEEEEENGGTDDTSDRDSNGGTNQAISAEEDTTSNRSQKNCQKRRRPGIVKVMRWVLKKVRGERNKSAIEACPEELDCTEQMECKVSIEERIVQDSQDPKESIISSNEDPSTASEMDEISTSFSDEFQSISVETSPKEYGPENIIVADDEDSGEVQFVSDYSASGETFYRGNFQKSSIESRMSWDVVDTAQYESEGKVLEELDDAERKTHDTGNSHKNGCFRICLNWMRKRKNRN